MNKISQAPELAITSLSHKIAILLFLLTATVGDSALAQTIANGDGTPLTTKYCRVNEDFPILGAPSGGTFSGCGVFNQGGQWYFNPVRATIGNSVFPVQCNLVYTVGATSTMVPMLVWKPVVITPPLEDSFTCNGEFYLHATTLYAGAYDYTWSPASTLDQPDSPNTAGYLASTETFVLTAIDVTSGCMGSDTVTIEKYPVPVVVSNNDTVVNARAQVQLQASGATLYLWQPSRWLDNDTIANPLATPQAPVTYQVIGINEYGCTDTAEVTIDIREKLLLPNAFSPNGDGLNDLFRIENFGYQGVITFSIFNRWGQRIFHTGDGTKGWDGTQNGLPVETGTYYYDIQLGMRDGSVKVYRGDLTLIR